MTNTIKKAQGVMAKVNLECNTPLVIVHKKNKMDEYVNLLTNQRSFDEKEVVDTASYHFCKQNACNGHYYCCEATSVKDEALVLNMFHIETRALKPDEAPRQWTLEATIIVFKDKEIVCKDGYNRYYVPSKRRSSSYSFDLGKVNFSGFNQVKEHIKNVWGKTTVALSGTHVVDITYPWHLESFIAQKQQKRNGKKQARVDELTAIELTPVEMLEDRLVRSEPSGWWWYRSAEASAVMEKVDKNTIAVRLLSKAADEVVENSRIYISDKDYIICKQNASGEWIQVTTNLSNSSWRFPLIVLDDVKEVENTKAKYFLSILEEIPENSRVIALLTFLTQPMFESYYKSGNKEHFIKMLESNWSTVKQQMENDYGKCNGKAKNFLGYIGVNKQQLKALEGREGFCKHVKEVFDSSNIASIDIKTFNNVLDVFSAYKRDSYYYGLSTAVEVLKLLAQRGIPTLNAMKDSIIAIKKVNRINGYGEIIGLYKDYLYMVSLMPEIHFKPQFDVKNAAEEITQMHDIVTQVYNTKRFEYQREAFAKAVGRVHKYEYKNSDYSVISPVEPEDLANEGLKLCHCVKSYINKVIEGKTNIMFIRKNTEPDESFFTVEISNGGIIEQIHGLRNRNLDTEPDLIPFVKEWVKAVKIKEGNFDKVR